ncbi:MAG: endo-1,4-beta-xylanase [Fervidobacterium sp.]|uniref:endo-1,4-beta-xylanase n=1 Tax=Fervidobacterium sp. TaxID=1871331 RepID=UPI00404B9CF7
MRRFIFLLSLAVFCVLAMSCFAQGKVIASFDFEVDRGNWQERGGGVSVSLVQQIAHSGSKSLFVANRTSGWHGVQIDLKNLLKSGRKYQFEGWVYQNSGTTKTIIITMQRTYAGESRGWDRIAQVQAPSGEWVKIYGSYSVKDVAFDEMIFYFESDDATLQFYVDDVQILDLSPEEAGKSLSQVALDFEFTNDFESSQAGFSPFGQAKLMLSREKFVSGVQSLKISNRKSPWEGVKIELSKFAEVLSDVDLENVFNVYQDSEEPQLFVVMLHILSKSGESFAVVTNKVVMPKVWTKVICNFNVSVENPSEVNLIIVSPTRADFNFFVDDFRLVGPNKVSKPGLVAKYDFEEEIGGWQPRGDRVMVDLSARTAHDGAKSLFVFHRADNWNGAQLSVKEILKTGRTYDFEAWVYQDSGTEQSIVMTMQRKYASDDSTRYEWIKQQTVPSGKWTKISGSYTVRAGETVEDLILYFESSSSPTLEFFVDDVAIYDMSVPKFAPQLEIPALKEVFKDYFKIGVALPARTLVNELDRQLVLKHFNSITAENEMKPESLLVAPGKYDFSQADQYIKFAEENNLAIRGHTLIWHSQTPDWFFRDETGKLLSREAMIARMREYIHTVVGHFKGKIYAWDVVNEAIDPSQPDGYSKSLWYQIIGPEYIELAFKFAHEADPNAKLFYNDYNEYEPRKRDFIYKLVKELKEKNVPIHGIGMQQHIGVTTSIEQIEQAIALFSTIPGIEIHMTEIDLSVYKDQTSNYQTVPYSSLLEQADVYRKLFDVYKKYSNVITSVTFWGLKDDYSWKNQSRNDWPLLFDKDYQAKLAYWAIVNPKVLPVVPKESFISLGSALVDGVMDESYLVSSPIKISADSQEKLFGRVIWKDSRLFIYANVYDATRDLGEDGITIFVDPRNFKAPYFHKDVIYVTIKADGKVEKSNKEVDVNSFVKQSSEMYSVECEITLPIEKLQRDQKVGLDILVNDGKKIYSWSDTSNQQKLATINYGTVTLQGLVTATAKFGTPAVDGTIDEIWKTTEEISTDVVVLGSLQNAKAKARMLWNEEYLYVLAIISDPVLNKENNNPWEQDSFEIFIDENNEKTSSYQEDDSQFRVNYLNEQSYGTGATPERFKTVVKLIEGGYLVEAAIKWKTIKPVHNTIIGFDIQVNDASAQGRRVGVLKWCDPTDDSWQNTSKLGNLRLID